MEQRVSTKDILRVSRTLKNHFSAVGYRLIIREFAKLSPGEYAASTKERFFYTCRDRTTAPKVIFDFTRRRLMGLERMISRILQGQTDVSAIKPDEREALIQAIEKSGHKAYLTGPNVMVADVQQAFNRLDGLFYALGYSVNKTKFARLSTKKDYSDSAKVCFFPRYENPGNETAPKDVLDFTQRELASLEELISGAGVTNISKLSEKGKEPLVRAIEKSRHKVYLSRPWVLVNTLAEIVKKYSKRYQLRGSIDMHALSRYVSNELKQYDINLSPAFIREAFRLLSGIKRLPRKVFYILQNPRPEFFDGRLPISKLTGGEDIGKWVQGKLREYGFASVRTMCKALGEETGIPFGTIQGQLSARTEATTVSAKVYTCFSRWERSYKRCGDIRKHSRYRIVDVHKVASIINELIPYFPIVSEFYAAAEPFTHIKPRALAGYRASKPQADFVAMTIYEGLLNMRVELKKVA